MWTRAFQVPKSGSEPDQCEDAWAVDATGSLLAIADGASDAFESRLWARTLVDSWVSDHPDVSGPEDLGRWLVSPIRAWTAGIQWDQLPWYSQEKARRGAYATFLALDTNRATPASSDSAVAWRSVAIGDCCLFQSRAGHMVEASPVARSGDFGTTPDLISTRASYNVRSLPNLCFREGECCPGDLLVLATDALAAWLLREEEEGRLSWACLPNLTQEGFAELVVKHRADGTLRNDDVTMILVQVGAGEPGLVPIDGSLATLSTPPDDILPEGES